jgi:translation initiation factor 2 alpha subunit (eIF-2alpha)
MIPHPHLRRPMALPRRKYPTWDEIVVATVAIILMFGCLAGFLLLG